jgi:sulfate adenylyltransferase
MRLGAANWGGRRIDYSRGWSSIRRIRPAFHFEGAERSRGNGVDNETMDTDIPAERKRTTPDPAPPYGGPFKSLLASEEDAAALKREATRWPSWHLSARQTCDLELILNGAFNPLAGFMGRADYERVCAEMRLADGTLWPIPVVLDVSEAFASTIGPEATVVLRDEEGVALALITVADVWVADRLAEAAAVYGTTSKEHPGVRHLLERTEPVYVGGRVRGLELPRHHDFRNLRHTPEQLRSLLRDRGCRKVVAFQTRNPMHRAHFELTLRAAREHQAHLLIHPAVGMTRPGDVDHFCRTRCYQALLPRYPENLALLSLLPLSMRMAGPREAVWHAILRRNYGCTHFIVGRDHAGPGNGFYPPYAAQELVARHGAELGVEVIPFQRMVYLPARGQCVPANEAPPGETMRDLSGTELRELLAGGRDIPEWFTFPEVLAELRKTYPPRSEQGFTIFFTGLSGAGKSTVARALLTTLLEIGPRPVTLLDGDIVRKNLSSELGFSREHRNLNIRRIGFVANEITKNGGIAICAPIAPYDEVRREVRNLIAGRGGFILVYLSTPLDVCETRDRKGLYAKARAGLLPEFTGVTDPYEAPADAEVVINTAKLSVEEACRAILGYLGQAGYLAARGGPDEPGAPPPNPGVVGLETRQDAPPPAAPASNSIAKQLGRRWWPLDCDRLCALARRRAGLEDFGDPPLAPALPTLLRSLEQEADPRPLGRFLLRVHLCDLLATRLKLARIWGEKREAISRQRLRQPVFIVGMPRSGSTFLHELLATDPEHRAPRVWEVMYPLAAGGDLPGDRGRYVRKAEACLWWFRRLAPQADSVYPMRAMTPHECVAIQSYTFYSEEFVSTCAIPSYEALLRSADLVPAYRWQKRFLQYLQLGGTGERWILKSPDHVHGLEALFKVFPDAILVQTHRNPIEVLKSSADLTRVLRGLYGRPGDPAEILAREASLLAGNTERFIRFRDRHPELTGRIIDLTYSDLTADPLAALRTIYARLDAPLSEAQCERARQLAARRSRYRGPRASARKFRDRFNLGAELDRFERYCRRFNLPFQGAE